MEVENLEAKTQISQLAVIDKMTVELVKGKTARRAPSAVNNEGTHTGANGYYSLSPGKPAATEKIFSAYNPLYRGNINVKQTVTYKRNIFNRPGYR